MINEERLLKVLVAPNISEKSTMSAELNNTVVFKVATTATKAEVKAAVEKSHFFKLIREGRKVDDNIHAHKIPKPRERP